MSKSSERFGSACRSAVKLLVVCAIGCGREDIELAPPPSAPPAVDDCSASVPEGLLAPRPPMGWNGYNALQCSDELDEAKVKANIEALVASGMQSAGYQHVNLDVCWELPRSAAGERVFDPERLPGGIAGLSQYVHERGFSLGVWAPTEDCQATPGGRGHETVDAESYAAWGIDYLKYVLCGTPDPEAAFSAMDGALELSGRAIVLSVSAAPFQEWMPEVGELWRTSFDAEPTWASLVRQIDDTVPLAAYARPGAFNDPDMLEIGNAGLTLGEQRVQFSVWSILSAPLLAGNDLSTMNDETRAILTNQGLIAWDQDPLGLQAALIRRDGDVDILAKPLAGCGTRAVVFFNRGEGTSDVPVTWQELWLEGASASVEDLWNASPPASDSQGVVVTVPPHDAVALRVTGFEPPLPQGRPYLSDVSWTYATNGFGPVEVDTTNGEAAALDGAPIRLRGAAYDKGLGVHGPSLVRYRLGQRCSRFFADVGIDDDQDGKGSAQFEVWADGERLFSSGLLTGTSPIVAAKVDVSGRRDLRLFVSTGGDTYSFDHAVWAGARLECDVSE